jgi:hypothetical protein
MNVPCRLARPRLATEDVVVSAGLVVARRSGAPRASLPPQSVARVTHKPCAARGGWCASAACGGVRADE